MRREQTKHLCVCKVCRLCVTVTIKANKGAMIEVIDAIDHKCLAEQTYGWAGTPEVHAPVGTKGTVLVERDGNCSVVKVHKESKRRKPERAG